MSNPEKYRSWPHFLSAYVRREIVRRRIRGLVSWPKGNSLEEGCTAVIGMCSRLPHVLPANLSCLNSAKWPDLKRVIITVDTTEDAFDAQWAQHIRNKFPSLNVTLLFYSPRQRRVASKMKLPYVYSWLSWAIALRECRTKVALFHDYDALILSDHLGKRYRQFLEAGSLVQGIAWYDANGLAAEDRLATTFEAFVDVTWLRRFEPIQMFNKVSTMKRRRVDFDTLLELQATCSSPSERDIYPTNLTDIVHPTQMIHQYTVYQKHPGMPWHCSALMMIPFFYYFSGQRESLKLSAARVKAARSKIVDLLGDGSQMNFSWLTPSEVDWMLKLMAQVCVSMRLEPFPDLIEYGNAFYELTAAPHSERWRGNFEGPHLRWITLAQHAPA
jgi:hypothetical protein